MKSDERLVIKDLEKFLIKYLDMNLKNLDINTMVVVNYDIGVNGIYIPVQIDAENLEYHWVLTEPYQIKKQTIKPIKSLLSELKDLSKKLDQVFS